MKMAIRDKGRYMDGRTPRNVMLSVYLSGQEWKCAGFGMVREPGIATWKYFSYPLSALSGVKTQRNHAIWLCLDFLVEGRVETACLPGLSNVSEVEQSLRERMEDRDKETAEEQAASREEGPSFDGKEIALQREDGVPADAASAFVSKAVREAVGLYRYPVYELHQDGESAAALYRDNGGSLCFLGADGSYQKEDRRVIEERHIHYYGPAGQVKGSKEAAASMPVDLSWIPHPKAYFLYWEEMGRRAASGERLPGVLLHYFDPKEGRCGDLLLPEEVLGFLREHFPETDWERQAAKREAARKAAAVSEKSAPQAEPAGAAGSGGAVLPKEAGAGEASGKSAGVEAASGKKPEAKSSAAVSGLSGRRENRGPETAKPAGSVSARTRAPIYGRPSYAKVSEEFEQGFSGRNTALHRATEDASDGGRADAGWEKEPTAENGAGEKAENIRSKAVPLEESQAVKTAPGRPAAGGGENLLQGGEASLLPHGLHDPNPGGKLTVSQYWDLAKELKKLWDDGIIDEPEYRRIKRGLLDRT